VVQQYVEPAVLAVLAWSAEPWRPRFAVRGAAAGGLVRFGGHYTVSSLMFYLVANADKVLIGVALGPAPLALYSQAFNLMMRPVNVVIGPMLGIMLPALSRAAPERRQFGELLLGFFRFTALVMFPAAVGLAIVAPEAMRVLGGPRWAPAGPILAVLALALLVQGFFNALGSVLASAGRADRLAYASMVVAAVLCAGFFVGLHLGTLAGQPLLGVAAAYTLGMVVIVFPAYVWFALRTVGVGNWSWLRRLGPAAMATLVMAGAVVACRTLLLRVAGLPDLGLLAIEIVVGVLVYVFVAGREIRWFLRRK